MSKPQIFINADTGIDDATAIVVGLFGNELKVEGILTTRGNMSVKQTTRNTLCVLQLLGEKEIPVYVGADAPLEKTNFSVTGVHGTDGIGDFTFPKLTLKTDKNLDDFYKELSLIEGKVSIICIAPLTNIALLLSTYPQCKDKIDRIIIEGGLLENDTTSPSFNVASDPKSAEIIFNSGLDITICPSDMGHTAYLNKEDVLKIQKMGKTGEMLEFIYRSYKDRVVQKGIATHDGCTVACLAKPELFKYKKAEISVRYITGSQVGMIYFDFKSKKPNANVCVSVDIKGFKEYLFDCIKKAP